MPLFLVLGPLFGFAALAAAFAHGHKSPAPAVAARSAPAALPLGPEHIELDRGMPAALVHPVLEALVQGGDPAALDALARQLGASYPLAAGELLARGAALRALPFPPDPSREASGSSASGGVQSAAAAPASSPDMGEAALILQAAMRALAQETDPVELEGFAESIRAKYPTAAVLLLGRARDLSAASAPPTAPPVPSPAGSLAADGAPPPGGAPPPAFSAATSDTSAAAASPPGRGALPPGFAPAAAAPPPTPATYAVQPGDTPGAIAAKLTADGKRWPELVAANPGKPTGSDGSFASLRPGETLTVPVSWGRLPAAQPHAGAPAANEARA
jgi:hypothetical protein